MCCHMTVMFKLTFGQLTIQAKQREKFSLCFVQSSVIHSEPVCCLGLIGSQSETAHTGQQGQSLETGKDQRLYIGEEFKCYHPKKGLCQLAMSGCAAAPSLTGTALNIHSLFPQQTSRSARNCLQGEV